MSGSPSHARFRLPDRAVPDGAERASLRTRTDPRRPDPLVELQRAAGNAAVTHLLTVRPAVQRRTEPSEGSSTGGVLPHHEGPVSRPAPAVSRPDVSDYVMTDAERPDAPAAADTAALFAENQRLYAARKARRDAAALAARRGERVDPATREFTPEEQARVNELNRVLKIRWKADIEETLSQNGVAGGAAAWYAELEHFTFLGQRVTVHRLLRERLERAANRLAGIAPPGGAWIRNTSSLREPGQSLHSFGLAIDLDPGRNPYLINPDARGASDVEPTGRSRAIADVINRAVLLVEARTPAEADLQSRPANEDRDARAMESYDKLATASASLRRYMELDRPENRPALDGLVAALGTKDRRTAEQWVAAIRADRTELERHAGAKSWRDPQEGFLSLDRQLVEAMTSSQGGGLTWLGDDTIGSGRDIMHFDMRGPGPIRRIFKSRTNRTTSLGAG